MRLYVLRGRIMHSDGMADVYLKVKLGSNAAADTKGNVRKDTVTPEFFHAFELDTELPGESCLKVCVVCTFTCSCRC